MEDENPFVFIDEPWEMVNGVACGKDLKGTLYLNFARNRVDIVTRIIPKGQTKETFHILIEVNPYQRAYALYTDLSLSWS